MCLAWLSMKEKRNSVVAGKVVVVAVKALKEIPNTALVWALTHVVQPGDYIKLLAVIPLHTSSNHPCLFFLIEEKYIVPLNEN